MWIRGRKGRVESSTDDAKPKRKDERHPMNNDIQNGKAATAHVQCSSKSSNFSSSLVSLVLLTFVAISLLISRRYQVCVETDQKETFRLSHKTYNGKQAHQSSRSSSRSQDSRERTGEEVDRETIKQHQIENYRRGTGLIINFHITHHGGTHLCYWAQQNGPSPSYYCIGGKNVPPDLEEIVLDKGNLPWPHDRTHDNIQRARPHFHYLSWEWGPREGLARSVNATNWEDPNLLSVIVMRNPIDRLISSYLRVFDPAQPNREDHQGISSRETNRTVAEAWWECANSPLSNNYALAKITSKEGCCSGDNTPSTYLEMAKAYIRRFTVVIDVECLDESLDHLSSLLNLSYAPGVTGDKDNEKHRPSPPPRQRMKNDTLYEYLVRRNRMDLLLYEWSRTISLVQCNDPNPVVNLTGLDYESEWENGKSG